MITHEIKNSTTGAHLFMLDTPTKYYNNDDSDMTSVHFE